MTGNDVIPTGDAQRVGEVDGAGLVERATGVRPGVVGRHAVQSQRQSLVVAQLVGIVQLIHAGVQPQLGAACRRP